MMGMLTYEMLQQAIDKLATAERIPCGSRERPHVVHPRDHKRGGWCICADCGGPVNIAAHKQEVPA